MIIQNGYIRLVSITDGGDIDPDTGYLRKATESVGDEIPCQWVTASMNRLATAGTEPVTKVSYTIYIETTPEFLTGGRTVDLLAMDHSTIGRFGIISEAFLDAVGQVRITV